MARTNTRTGGRPATTGHITGDYALAVGMPSTAAPDGWKWLPLTSLARLETGHTPSRQHPEYWDGDIPWIGIRDATANHGWTLCDTNQHTNQAGIDNSSARILPENTVCLSRTASVGYVVVMGRPMATSQDFVNWVCDPDLLDYRFLKYVLLGETRSFLRFAHGTTHQTIYFPEVKAFHLCCPPIEEQRAIAEVLGSLDDKIELNRRMNRTLEEMAAAIFKAWFVDFEPVKAKAAGAKRFPTMPQDVFDALPTEFTDSPLGTIPKGWHLMTWGDIATLEYGKGLRGYSDAQGPYRVYGTNGPIGRHSNALCDSEGVIVGRKGAYRGVHYSPEPFFVIDTAFYLRLKQQLSVKWAYYEILRNDINSMDSGSAIPSTSRDAFYTLELCKPPDVVSDAFEKAVKPLFVRRKLADEESGTLAEIRDALLPKLVSGEVRIGTYRELVKEAV